MTAAALSRSRGVAGVKTTRGLFFIFSLLCLVCLASSFINKDKLEKLKEDHQKSEQQLESLKELYKLQMASSLELMNDYMGYLNPMIALVKKITGTLPDDFPLDGLLQSSKALVEKTKTYVEDSKVKLDAEIENIEKNLEKNKKLIKYFEEQQGEL